MTTMKIHWNGFIKQCCEAHPHEACAVLYIKHPFTKGQELFVFPITNVHGSPEEGWNFDSKELARAKREAQKLGLVKIGNVHSHPLAPGQRDLGIDAWRVIGLPSNTDLMFAKKYSDVLRGILVVDKKGIYHHTWHDKYGNLVELYLVDEEEERVL